MTPKPRIIKKADVKKVEPKLSDVLKSIKTEFKRRTRSLEAEMLRKLDAAIEAASALK